MLQNGVFGHIKRYVRQNDFQNRQTLLGHINDDAKAITANVVQGWDKRDNRNFDSVSCGKKKKENLIHDVPFL
jgi:hypothetical protein